MKFCHRCCCVAQGTLKLLCAGTTHILAPPSIFIVVYYSLLKYMSSTIRAILVSSTRGVLELWGALFGFAITYIAFTLLSVFASFYQKMDKSPVVQQNLMHRFDGSALGDEFEGIGEAAPRGDVISPIKAAKLSFELWLKSVGPPRAVPRPDSFYKGVVDCLWKADVFTKEDLALCRDPAQLGGNTPGSRDFIGVAWQEAGDRFVAPQTPEHVASASRSMLPPGPSGNGAEWSDDMLMLQFARLEALQQRMQQKKLEAAKATPELDYSKALQEVGLEDLPFDRRPCPTATNKWFALAEKVKKTQSCTFVYGKLEDFLPKHSRMGGEPEEEEESSEAIKAMQKVMGVQKTKKTLSFLGCLESLDGYIVAGAMLKQFSLASGLAYLSVVKQVAAKAVSGGKRHGVAVS